MKRVMRFVLLLLSVSMCATSIYMLVGMWQEEQKSQQSFEEVREIFEPEEETDLSENPIEEKKQIHEGLLELHELNTDCIGWIQIEGTNIDYPVMYHPEEENFYLRKNFHKEYDISGTPYLAEICDPKDCDNLIIYGHHMNHGAMFADLEKYKKEAFYKEHPVITYHTLDGTKMYRVIASFATPVYTKADFKYYAFAKAKTPSEFEAYIETCKQKSYYEIRETASYGDELITLSTCEYSHKNGRMVVVGKRIMEEEMQ